MAAIRPRDLLSDGLLERLGGTSRASAGGDIAATLSRDIAKLGDVGYLNVALPTEFGGLGCTLRQAACGQRRLARHANRDDSAEPICGPCLQVVAVAQGRDCTVRR